MWKEEEGGGARALEAIGAGGTPCSVGGRPARTHERKRRRSRRILEIESASPLREIFTGGVEYDDRIDLARLARFIDDLGVFVRALGISPAWGRGIELKFRRLGRHRADGLYYPEQAVLAVDIASSRSFAHEFAHLMDYRSRPGPGRGRGTEPLLSGDAEFAPLHRLLVERIIRASAGDPRISSARGRLTRAYFASAAECFARAFEQFAAERLPPGSSLAGERVRYRGDPLFFEAPPRRLFEYFEAILARGPESHRSGSPRRHGDTECLFTSRSPKGYLGQ